MHNSLKVRTMNWSDVHPSQCTFHVSIKSNICWFAFRTETFLLFQLSHLACWMQWLSPWLFFLVEKNEIKILRNQNRCWCFKAHLHMFERIQLQLKSEFIKATLHVKGTQKIKLETSVWQMQLSISTISTEPSLLSWISAMLFLRHWHFNYL